MGQHSLPAGAGQPLQNTQQQCQERAIPWCFSLSAGGPEWEDCRSSHGD